MGFCQDRDQKGPREGRTPSLDREGGQEAGEDGAEAGWALSEQELGRGRLQA